MGGESALDLVYSIADAALRATQRAMPAEAVGDFVRSVRWGEPFIAGLVAMHVLLVVGTYATRRRPEIQFGILGLLTVTTVCGRWLNGVGHGNWDKFASQDYFDAGGLFMVTFVSGPFVLVANFIVLGLMLRVVKLYAIRSRSRGRGRGRGSQSQTCTTVDTPSNIDTQQRPKTS